MNLEYANPTSIARGESKSVKRGRVPVSYTHLTLPTSDLGVDLGGRRILKKKHGD